MNESDIEMIRYFWEEKGDITRWTSWEDRKPEIKKYHPGLVYAVEQIEFLSRVLDAIVRNLEE